MDKQILFVATTGSWWDHRYYYKQIPALDDKVGSVSYMVREHPDINDTHCNVIQLKNKTADKARITGGINLLRRIAKNKYDAVQICNVELLLLGILLAVFTSTKVFYDCREDHYNAMLDSKVWLPKWARYLLAMSVKILEFSAAKTYSGFVVSDPAIFDMHSSMPYYKKMIFYNMALKNQFDAVPCKERKYDLTVLGSMSVRTGVLDVVKAIGVLKGIGYKLRLKLIGDPTFDQKLWEQIKETFQKYDIQKQVEITGRVPYNQVPLELAECKIGIIPLLELPKFQNNIATKQFEYMASKLAIIASSLPPQRIFLEDDKNGLWYNPGDIDELSEKIKLLIDNSALREKLSSKGKELADSKWNAERQQEKYVTFYKKRLQGNSYQELQLPPFDI